ncbi:MAG: gluconate 2-dehydrogenase subunit 3 family protein [Acidobacteria bacterium]|nr:gluconate 2-dehydrogenase subunit 3 family protein [Acidobacteriota bacterium]
MKRREFLTIPAHTLGGSLWYSLAGRPSLVSAQQKELRVPLRFFTAVEAQVVTAACDRIFPSDENGPGAKEAAVIIYIDRQLAGPYGRDKYRYTKGPWRESVPEHGNQRPASPRETYRQGLALLGASFADQTAEEQDRRLQAIERTDFFQLLRTQTIEGMFCDPLHGGNAGMIGWQLIGFPGPVMTHHGQSANGSKRPAPRSLEQITGRRVKGWEDEA